MPLRLLNISSVCSRDVLDPVECEGWFLFCDCLSSHFFGNLASVSQCSSSSKFSRSSHRRCSIKKSCSEKFCNIHRKILVSEPLFNKVTGLQAYKFIKKRLQRRCFPVKIGKFLRTPILKNICKQLLLVSFVLIAVMTYTIACI